MGRTLLNALRGQALRWFPGDRDLRRALRQVRYGYRHHAVGLSRVRVDDLRVRKEPTLVAGPSGRGASRARLPARVISNPVDRFFPLDGGREDRRLLHLPHLEVLRFHAGNGSLPLDSDYARLLRVRALIQGRRLTEEAIDSRLQRLLATCRSIAEHGYLGPGHRRQRIVVMQTPVHPPTPTYRPDGHEIFDGHHRAVAVTHLGMEWVEVLVTRAEKVSDFSWAAESWDESLWERADPGAAVAGG